MTRIETAQWGLDNEPPPPGTTLENTRTGERMRCWLAVWHPLGWSIYVARDARP